MIKVTKSKEYELKLEFIFFTLSCFDRPSFYLIKNDLLKDKILLKRVKNSLCLKISRFKIILQQYYLFSLYNNSKNKIKSCDLLLIKNYLINFQFIDKIIKNYNSSYLLYNKISHTSDISHSNMNSKSLETLIALEYLEEYLKQ